MSLLSCRIVLVIVIPVYSLYSNWGGWFSEYSYLLSVNLEVRDKGLD